MCTGVHTIYKHKRHRFLWNYCNFSNSNIQLQVDSKLQTLETIQNYNFHDIKCRRSLHHPDNLN